MILVDGRRWVALSTCKGDGGDGSFVEGSKERRRSSGVAQNGFVDGWRS